MGVSSERERERDTSSFRFNMFSYMRHIITCITNMIRCMYNNDVPEKLSCQQFIIIVTRALMSNKTEKRYLFCCPFVLSLYFSLFSRRFLGCVFILLVGCRASDEKSV